MIVDLNLKDRLVIIIGGGSEALKKVNSLLNQGCKILVIGENINSKLLQYEKNKKITVKKEKVSNSKFILQYKPFLVMTTTNDKKLNQKIVKSAKKAGCYSYASDEPSNSDFAMLSVIDIDKTVQLAISTGGRSPLITKKLRTRAEETFRKLVKKADILQIKIQQIAREEARKKIKSPKKRKEFLYSVLNDSQIKQLIKDENLKKAHIRTKQLLSEWK